jgi:uncharacterized protein YbjT (DUF2867 family)
MLSRVNHSSGGGHCWTRLDVILVTGATGNVGGRLIRELAAAGAPTRALVRSPQAAASLQELGVEAVVGAFEDAESLRDAVSGVDRIYLVSPAGVEGMVEQQLQVLEAALAGGVARIVKQSSIAADERTDASIVAAHRRIEEAIERSGVVWTHLRPNWFMQNELGQAASIVGDGAFYAPDVTQVSMIDATDVAAVAARVLTSTGHEGEAYVLTGPQALSYADLAEVYSRVLGREVRWHEVTLEQARDSMAESGLPEALAVGYPEVMRRYRDGGVTRRVSPAVEELIGRPPRTFEEFVRDHRDAYAAAG